MRIPTRERVEVLLAFLAAHVDAGKPILPADAARMCGQSEVQAWRYCRELERIGLLRRVPVWRGSPIWRGSRVPTRLGRDRASALRRMAKEDPARLRESGGRLLKPHYRVLTQRVARDMLAPPPSPPEPVPAWHADLPGWGDAPWDE